MTVNNSVESFYATQLFKKNIIYKSFMYLKTQKLIMMILAYTQINFPHQQDRRGLQQDSTFYCPDKENILVCLIPE